MDAAALETFRAQRGSPTPTGSLLSIGLLHFAPHFCLVLRTPEAHTPNTPVPISRSRSGPAALSTLEVPVTKRLLIATFWLLAAHLALAQAPPQLADRIDIPAKLVTTLTPKQLKVGDPVALETTTLVVVGPGTVIPKSARLTGRITYASTEAVSLRIERAQWKTGSVVLNAFVSAAFVRTVTLERTVTVGGSPTVGSCGTLAGGRYSIPCPNHQSDQSTVTERKKATFPVEVKPDPLLGSIIVTWFAIPSGTACPLTHLDPDYNPELLMHDVPEQRAVVRQARSRADKNDVSAELTLANLYLEGKILRKDPSKAALWLEKAANQGDPGAQSRLGQMYFLGDGVIEDDITAYQWFRLAVDDGSPRDQENVAMLGKSMTPAQVAEGEHRVEVWKQAHPR